MQKCTPSRKVTWKTPAPVEEEEEEWLEHVKKFNRSVVSVSIGRRMRLGWPRWVHQLATMNLQVPSNASKYSKRSIFWLRDVLDTVPCSRSHGNRSEIASNRSHSTDTALFPSAVVIFSKRTTWAFAIQSPIVALFLPCSNWFQLNDMIDCTCSVGSTVQCHLVSLIIHSQPPNC